MNYRNTVILVIFVAGLLAAIWLGQLPTRPAGKVKTVASEPLTPSRAGEFRGFSLQLNDSSAELPYEQFIHNIARTGANTICFVVHGYQENASSTSIVIDARKTPPDERFAALIDLAHRQNLRTMIMPVVLLSNRRNNEWRGKINPDDWNAWWADYTDFVMHYARLAQATRCEIFAVGSELLTTETQTDRWRKLIGRVRQVYDGRLTYSANWDHYDVPAFWDAMDMVGMTSYYTLSEEKNPTEQQLVKRWEEIRREILEWHKDINRPLLFTEVGWPNQVTAAEAPWNYYAAPDQPDPALQARCFEAFFEVWGQDRNVAGILVWEWKNHPDQPVDPQNDTSYRPVGKPAMTVIQNYFKQPSPWADATPTSQAATRPADPSTLKE